jgi:hypothetical protein
MAVKAAPLPFLANASFHWLLRKVGLASSGVKEIERRDQNQ